MLIDDFIAVLQERNTGASPEVFVAGADGQLWEPKLVPDRINRNGDPPYHADNDFPFAYVIAPDDPGLVDYGPGRDDG